MKKIIALLLSALLMFGLFSYSPASATEAPADPAPMVQTTEPVAETPAEPVQEAPEPVPVAEPVKTEPVPEPVEAKAPVKVSQPAEKSVARTTTTTPKKVWVCKYVGKPGTDERLKDGKNPINVSVNSIPNYSGVGSYFADAQGRSYVVSDGKDDPGVASCPKGDTPPPVDNHNWKYDVTCEAVSGTRPNTDSVDSNIRIKNLATGEVRTFNYHGPDNGPSGPFSYNLKNDYKVPTDWTNFEIQWVQVNGTNYHFEGSVICGKPDEPVKPPKPEPIVVVKDKKAVDCTTEITTITTTTTATDWKYNKNTNKWVKTEPVVTEDVTTRPATKAELKNNDCTPPVVVPEKPVKENTKVITLGAFNCDDETVDVTTVTTKYSFELVNNVWVEKTPTSTTKVKTRDLTPEEIRDNCQPPADVFTFDDEDVVCKDKAVKITTTTITTPYVWDEEIETYLPGDDIETEVVTTRPATAKELADSDCKTVTPPADNPPVTDTPKPDEPKQGIGTPISEDAPPPPAKTYLTGGRSLPNTGGPDAGLLILGVGLIIAGGGALFATRRRKA